MCDSNTVGGDNSKNAGNDDADAENRIGFLIVTRKTGEGLAIGEDVHVIVNRIKDGQVRLAIYAPRSVPIQRSTLADRKRH